MSSVVAEVQRRGRVTFAEYMTLALYHPTAGYYTRTRRGPGPAGREGDFLTAPTASPVFARTLAALVRELSNRTGEALTLLEIGAGEGVLLERLCHELYDQSPTPLRRVVALEIGAPSRARICERCPQAETAATLAEVSPATGPTLLFASELYDALPVHRVTMRRANGSLELVEFYVEIDVAGKPVWVLGEPSDPAVASYLAGHGVHLEEGQIAELRPQARSLHASHLAWCGADAVALVIDYGYPSPKLYDSRGRRHGSLVGYRTHKLVEDVLESPGEIDITAHVNFDDLLAGAADLGWERGEVQPLGAFLAVHGALDGLPEAVAQGAPLTPSEWAELGEVKRLLLPTGMGSDLKVLAQGKGRLWQVYRQVSTPPPGEA
jgi:SAM-dependent MidA family methyltransferase